MKRNKILIFTAVFSLFGFLITGCDNNMPEVREIGVDSIELSEELSSGITLEVGTTADISWKVTLSPNNATDRAESYYSSNPEIATVNAKGKLTANVAGTAEITISVGGKSVDFTLTVVDKIIIPATNIELVIPSLELMTELNYSLYAQIKILPIDANDGVDYTSSAPEVVSVTEEGILEGITPGTAIITVASKYNASIQTTLPVTVVPFSGDYPRAGWTMSASHELFKATNDAEKNSLSGAFDGDFSTNFCLVRPGKSYGNIPNVAVPSGEAIYYIVDMKKPRNVNYFRILHRDVTQAFIRWYGFDEILGSNDGSTFDVIASNVVITNAGVVAQQESPNIIFPKSKYRYLKFYAKEAKCFYQSSYTSQGSSVQIQELYLGLTIDNP